MKFRTFSITITLLLVSAASLMAITGTEAVEKFRSRMFGVPQLTGIISWSMDNGTPYTGSFKYMSPGKIYVKFSSPAGKVIVSNGKKLWIYDPGSNVCGVQELAPGQSGGIAGLINGYTGIVTSQGNGYTLKLKNSERSYPEITLILDSTFFLKKAILKDKEGDSLRFSLSNVDTSATIMRGIFDFNVPANAQVVKNPLQIK